MQDVLCESSTGFGGMESSLRTQSYKNANVFPHMITNSCNFIEMEGENLILLSLGNPCRKLTGSILVPDTWYTSLSPQIGSELL